MLQEAYLEFIKVRPEVITSAKSEEDLRNIGKKIIYCIYKHRGRCKKHVDGSTSPLFEMSNTIDFYSSTHFRIDGDWEAGHGLNPLIDNYAIADDETQVIVKQKEKELKAEIASTIIFNGLQDEDFDTGVFVMAQIESINAMSKRTKINRTYLTKSYNKKREEIKTKIDEACRNIVIDPFI